MKEFWALVSFEYRKILGKRSVKIALLLTLFLSVFSIWGTLMGSYYICLLYTSQFVQIHFFGSSPA